MNIQETNPTAAEAASPNQKMVSEYVGWVRGANVQPHLVVSRAADDSPVPVSAAWVLRPPTEGARYQEHQPGIACNDQGRLFYFQPTDRPHMLELQRRTPAEGIDPSNMDEAWMSALLDTAQANVVAAAEAKMSLAQFEEWGRTRQAAGVLAVAAA